MFLNSNLHGQVTHYIDYDHKRMRFPPVKISIKPIQDHPQYTPDWLKERNIMPQDLANKEFTLSDIKIEKHEFTSILDLRKKFKP